MSKRKKIALAISLLLIGIVIITIISFLIYVSDYYKAQDVDEYLESSDTVEVSKKDNNYYFVPSNYDTGIIMYPGGKVETKAYAPICRLLAEDGYLVILLHMPFNLAFLDFDAADKIIDSYNDINFYLMGHSLGGAMSSEYLAKNYDKYEGMIYLASYTTKNLKNTNLRVLSMYGENDKVLNKKSYEKYKKNLPINSEEYIIKGGNHGYFGSYGEQKGDGTATITPLTQWSIAVSRIDKFIKEAE